MDQGVNNSSSMADYWAGVSQGYFKDELEIMFLMLNCL